MNLSLSQVNTTALSFAGLFSRTRPLPELLRQGDSVCWEKVLSGLQTRCQSLAWRILNDVDLASDAVQEGFLRAYRARSTIRDDVQVEKWILAIVANAARDAARSQVRERRKVERLTPPAPTQYTPHSSNSMEDALREALATLDADARLIFLLVHQEGFSYQEVASEMSWPMGTVRSTLHRTRMQLQELLHKEMRS
jgi:RNA polymerase sigma-70 factor (ECF subfamily)